MSKKSLINNYLYNVAYQLLGILTPLITSPYISRVLGADNIGIYSYTYSIVFYFCIFANLGISTYGNRAIAKCRTKDERNGTFCSILYLHILVSVFVLLSYLIYIFFFNIRYRTIAVIQMLYLISAMFDISWFFAGIEEFKLTVTRNAIIKVITTVMVFVVVRSGADLWKYCLLLSAGNLLGTLSLWCFIKRYVKIVRVKMNQMLPHLKPMVLLSISVVAVSVYLYIDKIMLGKISSITEVGYYENAFKAIDFPLNIITAFGIVMLPRASNMISNDSEEELKVFIDKSMRVIAMLSSAMAFGFASVSSKFSIVFWGKDFEPSGRIIMLLSIVAIFISWNNIIRTQYLAPKEKDKGYVVAVCLGATVDVILNYLFIPILGGFGAAIGTVGAYCTVFLVQNFVVRRALPVLKYAAYYIPYVFIGALMFIFVRFIDGILPLSVGGLVIEIIAGGVVFCIGAFIWIVASKDKFMIDTVIGIVNKYLRRSK